MQLRQGTWCKGETIIGMTPIKEWFCNWCWRTISLSSSFQDDSRLVCIFFPRALPLMILQSISAARRCCSGVCDSSTCSTSIFARVWMFAMYLKTVLGGRWRCQETGQYTRRDGGGVIRAGQQLSSRATTFSSVQGKGGLIPTEWPSTRHSCPETDSMRALHSQLGLFLTSQSYVFWLFVFCQITQDVCPLVPLCLNRTCFFSAE